MQHTPPQPISQAGSGSAGWGGMRSGSALRNAVLLARRGTICPHVGADVFWALRVGIDIGWRPISGGKDRRWRIRRNGREHRHPGNHRDLRDPSYLRCIHRRGSGVRHRRTGSGDTAGARGATPRRRVDVSVTRLRQLRRGGGRRDCRSCRHAAAAGASQHRPTRSPRIAGSNGGMRARGHPDRAIHCLGRRQSGLKAFAFGAFSAAGSVTLVINSPSAIRCRADAARYLKRASLSLAANIACGVAFATMGLIFVRGALHIIDKLV